MGALRRFWGAHWPTILVVGALAAGYLALRTDPSGVASTQEVMEIVRSREATLLYFYSNT